MSKIRLNKKRRETFTTRQLQNRGINTTPLVDNQKDDEKDSIESRRWDTNSKKKDRTEETST